MQNGIAEGEGRTTIAKSPKTTLPYVLVTPARNEGAFIEKTIESVIRQTVLPLKWVIVNDGSTDDTGAIVSRYLGEYPWIETVEMPQRRDRSFAGKVQAFNAGYEKVKDLPYEVIGNLDADISFERDQFEFLLAKFQDDAALGVAGTAYTQPDWDSTQDSFEGQTSVHGACQLFRKQCFLDVGGYQPSRPGGVDWIAVTTARMKGWKTQNFPDRRFHHYRTMGTAERSAVCAKFDYGRKDYFLGGSLIWEIFRAGYQMTKPPILFGGIALFLGYCWSALQRDKRPVSDDLIRFHRREQMRRLQTILSSICRFKRVHKYSIAE